MKRAELNPDLIYAIQNDALVNNAWHRGASLEAIIKLLVENRAKTLKEIIALDSIAPKKITDGELMASKMQEAGLKTAKDFYEEKGEPAIT